MTKPRIRIVYFAGAKELIIINVINDLSCDDDIEWGSDNNTGSSAVEIVCCGSTADF